MHPRGGSRRRPLRGPQADHPLPLRDARQPHQLLRLPDGGGDQPQEPQRGRELLRPLQFHARRRQDHRLAGGRRPARRDAEPAAHLPRRPGGHGGPGAHRLRQRRRGRGRAAQGRPRRGPAGRPRAARGQGRAVLAPLLPATLAHRAQQLRLPGQPGGARAVVPARAPALLRGTGARQPGLPGRPREALDGHRGALQAPRGPGRQARRPRRPGHRGAGPTRAARGRGPPARAAGRGHRAPGR